MNHMGVPQSAAELELVQNFHADTARQNFDKWFNEERAAEINERWRIKRKFLDAKGDDPSLLSKYIFVDVLEKPGAHKNFKDLLTAQIGLKHPSLASPPTPDSPPQPQDQPPSPPDGEEAPSDAAGDAAEKDCAPVAPLWISVRGCNYVTTEAVCKSLAADFAPAFAVEKLVLGPDIEADDAPCVADLLAQMPKLERLDLSGNKFETDGLKVILSALKDHPSITDVDLSNCGLANSAGKHLAEYLAANTPAQRLLLNGNKLGIYGTHDMCQGLRRNTNVVTLGLFFNNTGQEGAEHVLNVLREACDVPKEKDEENDENNAENDGKDEKNDEPPEKPEENEGKGADQAADPGKPPAAAVGEETTAADPAAAPGGEAGGGQGGDEAESGPRTALNVTLVQVEVGDNKWSGDQCAELSKILAKNSALAQKKELDRLKAEELARIEEAALAARKQQELEQQAQRKQTAAAAAATPAGTKGSKTAAPRPPGKKPGAKPSLPQASSPGKQKQAKPSPKAAKPAAKPSASLPALGKK
ncbi:RAN GTPase-activating protein 1 [Diplonema papillatum]|nr:RAN GTPase-activating protein 1 [Diplonema papillatum]